MQGKERNITNSDKHFEDQAWAEMRKKLDSEMPELQVKKSGKKRYLLLLLFLIVGFGAGIGTMSYFNKKEQRKSPNPVILRKDIAETSPSFKKEKAQIQLQTDKNEINNLKKLIQPTELKDNVPSPNLTKKSVFNKIKKTNNPIKLNQKVADNIGQNATNELNKIATKNQNQLNEKNNFLIPTTSLNFIDSKNTLLESPQIEGNLAFLEIPKNNKWKFGITLGNYSNTNSIFAGATLGGKAIYQLNRRFTIGSGLQYSVYSGFQKSSRNKSDIELANSNTPISNDTTGTTSTGGNTENEFNLDNTLEYYSSRNELPISNLHYLEIPIEIAYRFNKKFQLNLGFKTGLLLMANSNNNFSEPNSSLLANRSESNDILKNSLKKFDFAGSVGIGFYPTKNLGIDLRYNHGLVDITNDDQWLQQKNNTNKNVQLSLVYFFGKRYKN